MKVLIVYGSETGNTESLAEAIGNKIKAAGNIVKVLSAACVVAEHLCTGYDAALFGCSAWGTDEVELQGDFNTLFEEFDSIDIKGKKTFTVTKKIVQGKEKNIESLIKTDTASIESA